MTSRWLATIGIACLVAAQMLAGGPLARLHHRQEPVQEAFIAVTPGEFAGTLMLGGFRGLACDLLWIRADNAHDLHRYYESVAIFRAISRIQPRFEPPWTYMAWDMSYNICHDMEDPDAKWTWFMAGIEANVDGCLRNPQSERLLRHLAWIFHHRGDEFTQRIEGHSWAPLLQPLIDQVNRQLPLGERLPPIPTRPGATNFRLSAALHTAAVSLAQARGLQEPLYVGRLIPLAMECDGDIARNRGHHLEALRMWIDALERWGHERERYEALLSTPRHAQALSSMDSYARNEGHLRRKAAHMARSLAPTPSIGEETAAAIMARSYPEALALMDHPGWASTAAFGHIRWLDEP